MRTFLGSYCYYTQFLSRGSAPPYLLNPKILNPESPNPQRLNSSPVTLSGLPKTP